MDNITIQDQIYKKMTPQQKLDAALSLYHSARQLKAAWLRQMHNDWTEQMIEQAVREAFSNART
jgi:hypothetical protein